MEQILLESSVRAILLAGGTATVLAVLRLRTASARRWAWSGALLAMLALPIWIAWGPKIAYSILPTAHFQEPVIPHETIDISTPLQSQKTPKTETSPQPVGILQPNTPQPRSWSWRWTLWAIYLAGFSAMLFRLIWATLQIRRMLNHATVVDGEHLSSQCAGPITVGWLKPVIMLPEDWPKWPKSKRSLVLAHEREHLRRRDPLWQWIAQFNRTIFWFHPVAWWIERKLSVLIEQACDDEVIRQGHSPESYAEVLIDLARTVQTKGRRLQLGAAIDAGGLLERIERVLEQRISPPISRPHALASITTCLLLTLIIASCRLERRSNLAPGQPTMNELIHRRAAENQKYHDQSEKMNSAITAVTPESAQTLEAELKANPQDEQKRMILIRYYQRVVDLQKLNALALWYIEHAPNQSWMQKINAAWDRASFERGKTLWIANLKKSDASSSMYRNAARYLDGGDKPLAEQVLIEGQRKFPDEHWASDFGVHYAHTLLGAVGPTTEENVTRELSMTNAHGPYAQNVRSKLAESNDPDVLSRTAQWLMSWGGRYYFAKKNPIDFDVPALAGSYNDHAISIQPENLNARTLKLNIDGFIKSQRLSKTPMDQLTASERMWQLSNEAGDASIGRKVKDAESKIRELLAIAARNQNDPEYGNAIFFANMALGAEALRQGKKQEAARYLLASSEAPVTDRLRYGEIYMNLPRQLVDWGERETVAQFLDRCAHFNRNGKNMTEWSAQIRRGINPDLIPYSN